MHKVWQNQPLAEVLKILEKRHSTEIQLGLSRVYQAAQHLDLLSPACTVITVAGTNGKGSTVAALEALYIAAGYQVGSYTSPHLFHFNERICINGNAVCDAFLLQALATIEEGRGSVPLTYFEMTTLAALWHFKQHSLDIVILEVGLGGRQDATNIIDANLAIITTIDFDHMDYLGNTLEAIGYEKAGILRPDQDFIYADTNPPESIREEAKKLGIFVRQFQKDYFIEEEHDLWHLNSLEKKFSCLPKPKISLKAAASAIVATQSLQSRLPVSEKSISQAMSQLSLPGRLQYIPGKINCLFDVSHNPQGVRFLADYLQKMESKRRVHAIFSCLGDKDILGMVLPLKGCVDHWYPAQLATRRAASADDLARVFLELEMPVNEFYKNPIDAFYSAEQEAAEGDLIIVYGSFYTVAQIMSNTTFIHGAKETL